MAYVEIHTELVNAITAVQGMSGDPVPDEIEANEHLKLGAIDNFDSMRAAEVITVLSSNLGCEIGALVGVFDPLSYDDGVEHFEDITIKNVVKFLNDVPEITQQYSDG